MMMTNATLFDTMAESARTGDGKDLFSQLAELLKREPSSGLLFDAHLLAARQALGISLDRSETSDRWPAEIRDEFEKQVLDICANLGQFFLSRGDIVNAYPYYDMIGEKEPIAKALAQYKGDPNDPNFDGVIDIALGQAIHPAVGTRLLIQHQGICQAISAVQHLLGMPVDTKKKADAVKHLVRGLHDELLHRLREDITEKEGKSPDSWRLVALLQNRAWLFADDNYHIDTSHLNSVVRMARLITTSDELTLAHELCLYGQRLSSRFVFPEPTPFEQIYHDSAIFFETLLGREVERGLTHFKRKADSGLPGHESQYAIEIYIHLLTTLGHWHDAFGYASTRLNGVATTFCPSVQELCWRLKDWDAMARLAKERNDILAFTTALAQGAKPNS